MYYNVISKTFSSKFQDDNLYNKDPFEFAVDNDKVPVHDKTVHNSLIFNQSIKYLLRT